MTGDSACFVDPLFSSGVHLALMSGVMAAAYATTALKADDGGDEQLRDLSGEVYQELYYREYNQFREMARLFYSSNLTSDSYFWEARRITGENEYTPRQSFIQAVAGSAAPRLRARGARPRRGPRGLRRQRPRRRG